MEDTLNLDSQPEIVQPEVTPMQEAQIDEKPKEVSESKSDNSWLKKLRKNYEQTSKENRELLEKTRIQEQIILELSQKSSSLQSQERQKENSIESLRSQDYVEGAKVADAFQSFRDENKAELENLKREIQSYRYHSKFENLRKQYPDLDDVVNPATLTIVKNKNPDLAESWLKSGDDYAIAVQAYPYIKHSGILKEIEEEYAEKETEQRLHKNKSIVPSIHALDKRPLAQAFKEPATKQEKEKLWQETLKYASMSGGRY